DYRMKYNEKGNLIEETNVDDLGRVLERKTMTYDGNGRMLTKKVEFLHTAEARMITESWFEYAYNSSGVLQSKTGWENEKEDQKVNYKYQITSGSEVVSQFNSANELQEKW